MCHCLKLSAYFGPSKWAFFENPEAYPVPFLNSMVADDCIPCLGPGSLEIAADPGIEEIDAAPDLNPKTVKKHLILRRLDFIFVCFKFVLVLMFKNKFEV